MAEPNLNQKKSATDIGTESRMHPGTAPRENVAGQGIDTDLTSGEGELKGGQSVRRLRDTTSQVARKVRDATSNAAQSLSSTVQQNPSSSVLVTFGIGILVGAGIAFLISGRGGSGLERL